MCTENVNIGSYLFRFDKFTIPPNADSCEDVVTRDHDRVDIGIMEALDGRVRLLLHQVLHHDQAKELGFFFQVGSVKNKISKISTVVLSWWCLTVLNYSVLYLIVLHLTLV